jgi:hypothetical protein
MIVSFEKLPLKAYHKRDILKIILANAEDHIYFITQIDYPCGMIKFESMQHTGLFIMLYTSKLTVTIEYREKNCRNKQIHFRDQILEQVLSIFKSPMDYIKYQDELF